MAKGRYQGITVDITFQGNTTKFNEAVTDVDKGLKSIDQELGRVNKDLKLDPSNATLIGQKFDLLGEKIAETRKKLQLLQSAQKEIEQAYSRGEIDKGTYRDFQRELAKTESQLKSLETEAKETAKAMSVDLRESAEELGAVLAKTAAGAAALITALGGITMSAATATDDLNTLSKQTGLSVETLQKFQYASKLVDVSQSTLSSSLRKLTMNMQSATSGTGKAYEAFHALGVEFTKSNGELRDSEDVFNDLLDALNGIDNEAERDAYAMNIFGRSAMDLNPLIIAGSKALEEYGDQAERMGLVFGGDTLNGLQEFQDKVDISKRQLEGVKMIVGSELVDSFETLFGGVENLLKLVQQAKQDGTLKAIADDVASAVSTVVDLLTRAAKVVYEFRVEIAAGVTGLIAFKSAIAISDLIKGVTKALMGMTGAQELATAAQEKANFAAAANPYIALAAGVSAVATALTVYIVKTEEAKNATGEATAEAKEYAEAQQAIIDSTRKAAEAHTEAIDSIGVEKEQYQGLIDRIYELADKENLTSTEHAELVGYIDELNSKMPNLNLSFNAFTGELSKQKDELMSLVGAYSVYMEVQSRTEYGVELAKQEITLTQARQDAEEQYNEAKQKRDDIEAELARKQTELTKLSTQLDSADFGEYGAIGDQYEALEEEVEQLERELKNANATVGEHSDTFSKLSTELRNNQEAQEENRDTIFALTEELEDTDDATKDYIDDLKKLNSAQEKQSQTTDKTRKSVSDYRSELTNLLSVLDNVNKGTAYSTSQIIDLLGKYPELASAIQLTADGYRIEAEAVENLTKVKAQELLISMQAQIAKAKAEARVKETMARIGAGITGDTSTLERIQAEIRGLDDTLAGYERLVNDIASGRIYSGSSSSRSSYTSSGSSGSSSSSEREDKTDYYKQQAEAEIDALEHEHKMGRLLAEEYYTRLDELNKKWYLNKYEYLDDYRKYEEKVYAGLEKIQEDRVKAAKDLESSLVAVKKAQDELDNASSQKVNVYSSAAGYHAEVNSSAISKAQQSLFEKEQALSEILSKTAALGGLNAAAINASALPNLRTLLPDLSGLRLPGASGSTTNTEKNVQISYSPEITIQGNATAEDVQRLKDTLEQQFNKLINDYISKEYNSTLIGG
jgi:DNA repair exonuclease SbcCD ATPase subunit